MNTMVYQCPCCGAPLSYEGAEKKLICKACGNAFETDAMEAMVGKSGSSVQFASEATCYAKEDAVSAYLCKNCGAELMTDATTTATECPYCGSPTVLPAQIEGGVKPEKVIPFRVTKEEATAAFEDYFKGKPLLPKVFTDGRNRIAEMKKLYVPYWLFGCVADAEYVYSGTTQHVSREGDWEVTTTRHYMLHRKGSVPFRNIPVDGSVKMDDCIGESLEPYDMSEAVPFQTAVLAGALADRADVEAKQCKERAVERVESSVESYFRNTTGGFSNVTVLRRQVESRNGRMTPVLMPVWMIATDKTENGEKKRYTFAINGQTGKLTTDVQPDGMKSFLWGTGVFAGVTAGVCLFMALMNSAEYGVMFVQDSMIWIAALIGLMASVITLLVLRAQLHTASWQKAAGNYLDEGGVYMEDRSDHYLYQTKSRRKIEQNKR